ncbi:MAG: Uma2 family endonuclease [Thiolinea sp.]
MGQALPQTPHITPEKYLEEELLADFKSEYVDGEIEAMAGASDRHVTISGNALALLKTHLRGSGCRTYISDMKVRVEADNAFYYPDVVVSCDADDQQPEQDYAKRHPKLIIEVLSPSTADKDRGSKFASYRKLPSLEEYLLIDQDSYYVELFRRQNIDEWVLMTRSGADAVIELHSIDFTTTLADFYEDVRWSD